MREACAAAVILSGAVQSTAESKELRTVDSAVQIFNGKIPRFRYRFTRDDNV